MSIKVFISCHQHDKEFANMLFDNLEANNYGVWMHERSATAGTYKDEDVKNNILSSDVFLYIASESSGESEQLRELNYAVDHGKKVIPILIDSIELPYIINRINKIDFFGDFKVNFATLRVLLNSLSTNLSEQLGDLEALLIEEPNGFMYAPPRFIGRRKLIGSILGYLKKNNRVLLQGISGVGKTSIVTEVAKQWMIETKSHTLWLNIGNNPTSTLLNALVAPFNAAKVIATTSNEDAKINKVKQILARQEIALVVLDDAMNGQALNSVMKAIPTDIPILVTAQQRFPVGKIIEVPVLADNEAISLVKYYCQNLELSDEDLRKVCETFDFLPEALVIAAKSMLVNEWNAENLVSYIESNPLDLTIPEIYGEPHPNSLNLLYERIIASLDKESLDLLYCFGAFSTKTLSPLLITLYWSKLEKESKQPSPTTQAKTPETSTEVVSGDNPESEGLHKKTVDIINAISEDVFADLVNLLGPFLEVIQVPEPSIPDTKEIINKLEKLVKLGLVKCLDTQFQEQRYEVTNIIWAYCKTKLTDNQRLFAVDACATYAQVYRESSLENFTKLQLEFDNLFGAAESALNLKDYYSVARLTLYLDVSSKFMTYKGYYEKCIILHSYALQASRARRWHSLTLSNLINLGSAYFSAHVFHEAKEIFQDAEELAYKRNDKEGIATVLNNFGCLYRFQGKYEDALTYFNRSLEFALSIENTKLEGTALGNMASIYNKTGKHKEAIPFHEKSVELAKRTNDKEGESRALGNLGNAYLIMNNSRKAHDCYLVALEIAKQIDDGNGQAVAYINLGSVYIMNGQYPNAMKNYKQALEKYKQANDRRGTITALMSIANINIKQGQDFAAEKLLKEALGLARSADDTYMEAGILLNLAQLYAKQNETMKAIKQCEYAKQAYSNLGLEREIETVDTLIKQLRRPRYR